MAEYEPLMLDRGEGCTSSTSTAAATSTASSSLWCNVHGHRHPRIDAAIREQLDRVAHVSLLGASNPTDDPAGQAAGRSGPAGPGARLLLRRRGHGRGSGAEDGLPVLAAAAATRGRRRPATWPWARPITATRWGASASAASRGSTRCSARCCSRRSALPAPDAYRLPPGVPPRTLAGAFLAKLERLLAEHHARIAALVIEPLVQAAAGMIVHPRGYLRGVRELTRKYDVLLIADEVAVGFGRTGRMFACEHEGVSPDLLCIAKGLTGGYLPMAATLATDEIWQAFLGDYASGRTFFHGHTYGGNPLGAAAALATLDVFEEERTLEHLPEKIARLGELLAPHRPASARRRCPPVRPDRRHRVGPRSGDEGTLSRGGAAAAACAGSPAARRALASAWAT